MLHLKFIFEKKFTLVHFCICPPLFLLLFFIPGSHVTTSYLKIQNVPTTRLIKKFENVATGIKRKVTNTKCYLTTLAVYPFDFGW